MKHAVIPDCQVKPGVNTDYLTWVGQYLAEKQPDKIICIGDFADMPSLSSYDVGKKTFEGRRYREDILSSHKAMDKLFEPINELNKDLTKRHKKRYTPELYLTLGNHENRINKVINNDPKLEGTISIEDLRYADWGWKVHDFLDVVVLDGIAYSHYFVTGVAGRPASTAAAQLRKTNMSCVAGHQQGRQVAYATRADGKTITSIIAGSCYSHNEDYLGAQGNKHWRGILMLHEVNDGAFDEMWVSLKYLKERYA
ncbi:metallophosphoesterase [Microcystis sp. M42BS1]|uniref:metallophosphoesterase n=1 Tax=Microcystis sp. M42BS1 TaxID=2771192 RepID=UPI002584FC01|nr:metallophosphoesterase [Microcystis sp. M42BS1]MCA2570656.1 metallophosphoesterase [Microcystis sp. M42BS1]